MFCQNKKIYRYPRGFTLIELSIVIVIIGLIVAGVIGGQSLVRQARLKSIISDYNSYEIALNAFKLEYNSLPGDIRNAHSYWPNCNSGATPAECNGDGSGGISWNGNVAGNESTRAWQHLNLAEILPGSFTGSSDPNGAEIGVNVPKSSFEHCGYWFWSGAAGKQTYMILGAVRAVTPGPLQGGCLSGVEMNNIDVKMDDGIIDSGRITGSNSLSPPRVCSYFDKTAKSCITQFLQKR